MPKVKTFNRFLDGEHLISEADGRRSREQIVIDTSALAAGYLDAGTVLGKVTATGRYVLHDAGLATGAEVAAGVLYARVEKDGTKHVRAVGHFRDCEINGRKIFWKAAISAPNKAAGEAALATKGVIVRY